MLKFAPYVLKSLWRRKTRTLLTVSGSAVAIFVFAFVGALQEGLGRLQSEKLADRTLVVFQANRFCPSTSRLPEDYARRIAALPGVKDVTPIQVYTNNCRASLDVIVFFGLVPSQLRSTRKLKLIAGDWTDFEGRRDAAIVGQAVAERRKLKVGQRFSIGEISVTVAGIFQGEAPVEDNYIYTHLAFLQRTRGADSVAAVTQFEVELTEGASADTLCRSIDDLFRSGPVATNTRTKGVFQANTVGDLVELIGFTQYLGFACVGLVLSLVATTAMMGVQDRIQEHAVLQTIGFTGYSIFGLVISESILISIIGGTLGMTAALAILSTARLSVGAEAVLIAFLPSVQIATSSTFVSILVGFIAGSFPALRAATADIVPALRQP